MLAYGIVLILCCHLHLSQAVAVALDVPGDVSKGISELRPGVEYLRLSQRASPSSTGPTTTEDTPISTNPSFGPDRAPGIEPHAANRRRRSDSGSSSSYTAGLPPGSLPSAPSRSTDDDSYTAGLPPGSLPSTERDSSEPGDHNCDGGGAKTAAVGLIFTAVVLPSVLYMVLMPGRTSDLVLKLIDYFVAMFMAVLWFDAFSTWVHRRQIHDLFPYAEEIIALVQFIVFYLIVMTLAFLWRDQGTRLITFCSCAAHYVAFAGIRTVRESQAEATGWVDNEIGHVMSFVWCGLSFAMLAGVSRLFHAWFYNGRKDINGEEIEVPEIVDEMELDILGLVMSFCITQAVRHTLTGRYPPTSHLLQVMHSCSHQLPEYAAGQALTIGTSAQTLLLQTLQDTVAGSDCILGLGSSADGGGHTNRQRLFMLIWALSLTVLAVCVFPLLDRYQHTNAMRYWNKKGMRVYKVIHVMCIAWGFLLWGEWEFYENLYKGEVMFGSITLASLNTLTALILIALLARIDQLTVMSMHETTQVTIMGASLVAAWSWEHCFGAALGIVAREYDMGYGGLIPKTCLAIAIPAVMLPVYVHVIKPRVLEAERREQQREHSYHEFLAGGSPARENESEVSHSHTV